VAGRATSGFWFGPGGAEVAGVLPAAMAVAAVVGITVAASVDGVGSVGAVVAEAGSVDVVSPPSSVPLSSDVGAVTAGDVVCESRWSVRARSAS
jgi:hypothetical protein